MLVQAKCVYMVFFPLVLYCNILIDHTKFELQRLWARVGPVPKSPSRETGYLIFMACNDDFIVLNFLLYIYRLGYSSLRLISHFYFLKKKKIIFLVPNPPFLNPDSLLSIHLFAMKSWRICFLDWGPRVSSLFSYLWFVAEEILGEPRLWRRMGRG